MLVGTIKPEGIPKDGFGIKPGERVKRPPGTDDVVNGEIGVITRAICGGAIIDWYVWVWNN